ncbi:synaptogenesis protein syg-2-like isoform X2 [Paramacrobiotus metropolitanus]|uniref:synaptogenesis protein syg-2-like isoform X2 n=1 Tax=Paramacrobiotus metropolitanus TaxID=2943436 RepID=UPI002445DD0D|nr:synaptogenesis protein syg-2-like isoform X2 [Paramacrobiotus metropolitanus]
MDVIRWSDAQIKGHIAAVESTTPAIFSEPMENQTVHLGQTATFACRVASSRRTGWKHGDRLIFLEGDPGSSKNQRYSTDYKGPTGLHVLTIANVTADDDDSVSCFAYPPNSDAVFPTIMLAYLKVLVPPSDIVIFIGSSRSPASATGSNLKVRMGEMVNLTCFVPDGRPTPKLVWYRSSKQVDTRDNAGYAVGESSSVNGTYSSLIFRAKPDDNDVDFTCQAESIALSRPLARSVKLLVLFPPSTPVIRDRDGVKVGDKVKVRKGERDFRLLCSSDGGNPIPQLTWFRNNIQEDSAETTHLSLGRAASAVLTFVPREIDNGAMLKCEAVNELMPRGVDVQTTLSVLFGPSTVNLKTPREARPGSSLDVNCTSNPSNPAAEITWTINNRPFREKSVHYQPTNDGAFITTSTIIIKLSPDEYSDISVTCQAANSEISEVSRTSAVVTVTPKIIPMQPTTNKFDVYDAAGNPIDTTNATDVDSVGQTGTKPENLTMIVAVSASVGGAVFCALLGCLIYVLIRGKSKKFEEMANSDSSGSSKGHTEVCSQNGMDTGTETTGFDVEKTPVDSYSGPKNQLSPSAVRTNAASTYLLDEPYHSPYGTYKHWTAPEPTHDLENEMGVDYDAEDFYIENLRRTARQTMQPHTHSPSPLRPIPNHLTYEPIHKTSLLSTFNGQAIPTYRAEALVDELKGHLV